jgi:transposase-like protein
MPQCPSCHSTNVIVTEEVYTRKGRAFYNFWQTVVIISMILLGYAMNNLALGFMLALGGAVIVSIFSLINASKKSVSRTKVSCLSCKQKTLL